MRAERVIFISGTGRSGTNILKQIFARHTEVASLPFEYRFTIDPDGVIDFYNSYPACWSPYMADKKIKRLTGFLRSLASQPEAKAAEVARVKSIDPVGIQLTPPPYPGWELEKWFPGYGGFIDELEQELVSFKYAAVWPGAEGGVKDHKMFYARPMLKEDLGMPLTRFLSKCYDAVCSHLQKPVFVEDNTHSILFAGDLLDLVPDAKLIHVVRDPRDVISSLKQQRWAPKDTGQAITWYTEVMNRWQHQRVTLSRDAYLELRFEDLVREPEKVMNRVCEFTGIGLEDAMLQVNLGNNNIGRHVHDLTAEEIRKIETGLKHILKTYGYD